MHWDAMTHSPLLHAATITRRHARAHHARARRAGMVWCCCWPAVNSAQCLYSASLRAGTCHSSDIPWRDTGGAPQIGARMQRACVRVRGLHVAHTRARRRRRTLLLAVAKRRHRSACSVSPPSRCSRRHPAPPTMSDVTLPDAMLAWIRSRCCSAQRTLSSLAAASAEEGQARPGKGKGCLDRQGTHVTKGVMRWVRGGMAARRYACRLCAHLP